MNPTNLPRYIHRHPRYILKTYDNSFVRFAGPKSEPWEEDTKIENVSLTGLAFTAPSMLAPKIDETIKIQFEVPGGTQMACYAKVNRLEVINSERVLVAILFQGLELPHRILLKHSIGKKLEADRKVRRREQMKNLPAYLFFRFRHMLAFFLALLTLMFLWNLMNTRHWIEMLGRLF